MYHQVHVNAKFMRFKDLICNGINFYKGDKIVFIFSLGVGGWVWLSITLLVSF